MPDPTLTYWETVRYDLAVGWVNTYLAGLDPDGDDADA